MKENDEENSHNNEKINIKKIQKEKLKIAVIGDHSTGKTSLIYRLCNGIFPTEVKSTLSTQINYYNNYKSNENDEINYDFEFNDLAGQDYSIVINKIILNNIIGIIFCCSSDEPNSLKNIEKWNEVCIYTLEKMEEVPKFIIINKIDKYNDFIEEKIKEVKENIKAEAYYYISAKENEIKKGESNQKTEFNDLFEEIIKKKKKVNIPKEIYNEKNLDLGLGLKRSNSEVSQASSQKEPKNKNSCC